MREKKFTLAHHKTEVVMISNRKVVQQLKITVGEHIVNSKREVKHLGVMIDDRLSFNGHVDYVCEKAARSIKALIRITPNNSVINSSKKRLLASVTTSIMRYGGSAWASALKTKRNQKCPRG
ncbi:uncharacterized protein LOC131434310 [Malaya genurostris]|uniref:uncharacterized protein LOC131434310 n=1 Tax=Malaya genurostris TaxID=325434 RepID=UPI0026F3C73C|nr:uncharacterized protein LOC131434310 [Malaya genurostris]